MSGNAFRSALSGGITPLEIHFEDDALTVVSTVAGAGGIVLLGETHGVVENATVLDVFVRRLGPAPLGLELNASVGAVLSDFALVAPQPVRGPRSTPVGRRFAADPAFKHRDTFYPMGWHLAQVASTVSVRLRYGRGTYRNFGVKHFVEDSAVTDNSLRFQDQELTVDLLDVTAATVPEDD